MKKVTTTRRLVRRRKIPTPERLAINIQRIRISTTNAKIDALLDVHDVMCLHRDRRVCADILSEFSRRTRYDNSIPFYEQRAKRSVYRRAAGALSVPQELPEFNVV